MNINSLLPKISYSLIAEYMGTVMSIQRPTGWFAFFSPSSIPGLGDVNDFGSAMRAFTNTLNTIDMVMRLRTADFGESDVTFETKTLEIGKVVLESFNTNNTFTLEILESPTSQIDTYFSSWRGEFYDPQKRALKVYKPAIRDREPYKRDFIVVNVDWKNGIPLITRFKGVSGCFPLSWTQNDESYKYDNDSPGLVKVNMAADTINTLQINVSSIIKNW